MSHSSFSTESDLAYKCRKPSIKSHQCSSSLGLDFAFEQDYTEIIGVTSAVVLGTLAEQGGMVQIVYLVFGVKEGSDGVKARTSLFRFHTEDDGSGSVRQPSKKLSATHELNPL